MAVIALNASSPGPTTIQRGETVVVYASASSSLITAAAVGGVACTILSAYIWSGSCAVISVPWSVGPGSYTLTVTFSNGDTGSCSLTVTAPARTRLYLCADSSSGLQSATSPHDATGDRFPGGEQAAATADLTAPGAGMATNVLKSQKGQGGAKNEQSLIKLASALGYQRVQVARFQTLPLGGIATIAAGSWKFRGVSRDYLTATDFTGIPDKIALYVWRPTGSGTGTIVGTIFDNTNNDATRLCAARASTTSTNVAFSFAGAQVSGVQPGDVLCLEWWSTYDTTVSLTNKTLRWFWGGLTDPGDIDNAAFADPGSNGAASYIEAPRDLWALPVTLTSVTPSSGPTVGGTAVTLTGSGFTDATGATIGGVALTSFAVVNDTTITGVTGAHAAGAVDVVVTVGAETTTLAGGYTYVAPPPPPPPSGSGMVRPIVRYRTFRSDDLSKPLLGPLQLEVQSIAMRKEGAAFEARAPRLSLDRTGETYDLVRFPALRGFL